MLLYEINYTFLVVVSPMVDNLFMVFILQPSATWAGAGQLKNNYNEQISMFGYRGADESRSSTFIRA